MHCYTYPGQECQRTDSKSNGAESLDRLTSLASRRFWVQRWFRVPDPNPNPNPKRFGYPTRTRSDPVRKPDPTRKTRPETRPEPTSAYDNRGIAHDKLTLKTMCDQVNNKPGITDNVQKVANVLQWYNSFYSAPGTNNCNPNNYTDYVETYKSGSYVDADVQESRSWVWLTCTALGYFQTTDGRGNEMFGSTIPVDFYSDQCVEFFSPIYNLNFTDYSVIKYRNKYGGAKNYKGTKCVFPNGSYDPWKDLGLRVPDANNANEVYAMTIEKGAHCSDMYPASDKDSQSLKDARAQIGKYITQFINESPQPVQTTPNGAETTTKASADQTTPNGAETTTKASALQTTSKGGEPTTPAVQTTTKSAKSSFISVVALLTAVVAFQ
uniref:Serine protease K12H4.7 n=1 Tax=Steinernema glaseri TaxID=37863 RepID=A0A1I7YAX2_9BILA